MSQASVNAIQDKETGKIIVQTPFPPINCLVLEGCGVRGAAYAGAAKVLETYEILADIEYIAGTSAGAIAALILALGYSAEEAHQKLCELSIASFLEGGKSWAITPDFIALSRQIFDILTKDDHALSSGDKLLQWLRGLVAEKLGNPDATFEDLFQAKEHDKKNGILSRFKHLYITGTDLSLSSPECKIFSYEKDPKMSLALAADISATFPFIFKPVEWQGHKHGDGGLKNNFPMKIFDKRKFLPEGYNFTEDGHNPGILGFRIDTLEEIEQVIWSINKETSVESTKEIATAVCNALSQTDDISEIREKRMVVPLPDGKILTLQFSIDMQGKIKLISTAEGVTQEFLENHAGAAYDVKFYKNIQAWLEAQKPDDIDQIIAAYEDMKLDILQKKTNLCAVSLNDLQERIDFLEKYSRYRRDIVKKRNPIIDFVFPTSHINIPPVVQHKWHKQILEEMQKKLVCMKNRIEIAQAKIDECYTECFSKNERHEVKKLHDLNFENVKRLTGLLEYLKLLEEEKRDLETKLGDKVEKKVTPPKIISEKYHQFYQSMRIWKETEDLPASLKAALQNFELINHKIIFKSASDSDNIIFSLDFRNIIDNKLFLIACLLYLEYRSANVEHLQFIAKIKEIYAMLFGVEIKTLLSMSTVATLLNQQGIDLLVSTYRIEELLHSFESIERPKDLPSIDIDQLLKASTYSIYNIKEKRDESEGYNLKSIFSSQNTLIFKKLVKNNQPNSLETPTETEAPTPPWFFSSKSYN